MSEISFVDHTLRDGPQSLWANRMTAPAMLSIAPTIDRAGYKRVEGPALNHFIVHLRFLKTNPWDAGFDSPTSGFPIWDCRPASVGWGMANGPNSLCG